MTNEECRTAYEALLGYLRMHKMGWLADTIEADVAEGKDEEKRVNTFRQVIDSDGSVGAPLPSRSAVRFIHIMDYTGKEKLAIAIDAIEATVVETAFMERDFFRTLTPSTGEAPVGNAPDAVAFSSDRIQQPSHRFTRSDVPDRVQSAEKLQTLLSELRKEI